MPDLIEDEESTGIINSATTSGTTTPPAPTVEAATAPVAAPVPDVAPLSETAQTQPSVEPVGVTAETETVAGQMENLLGTGSSYIDLAKQDAVKTAAKRGLINTSIAAGAGTEAAIRAALPIAQQDAGVYEKSRMTQNEFLRDEQSSNLNKEMAALTASLDMEGEAWSAELQTNMDLVLSDAAFSDETKLQIITSINNLITDTNQQVADIGLSDTTPEQQASAIALVYDNRDNEIAMYQDMLSSFNDWEWSTDFTPEVATPTVAPTGFSYDSVTGELVADAPTAPLAGAGIGTDASGN